MRNLFTYLPVAGLILILFGVLQEAFPAAWGPSEPSYQLVIDYRGEVRPLEQGMTHNQCQLALPYSDRLKQVAFTCEREG
jgi:hypothetical protein